MGKDTIDDNKLIIEDNIVSQKATRSNKPVGEAVSTDEQIEQLYKDLLKSQSIVLIKILIWWRKPIILRERLMETKRENPASLILSTLFQLLKFWLNWNWIWKVL